MELLQHINILGGVGFAMFAVLVGTKITETGIRDYVCILTIAVLATASIIEHWFMDNSLITSCLIGFSIGFLADDVFMNLKATIPDFIKEILQDVFASIKARLHKLLG